MNICVLLLAGSAVLLTENMNHLQLGADFEIVSKTKMVLLDGGNGINDCKLYIEGEKLKHVDECSRMCAP